jgi:lysophospholipase
MSVANGSGKGALFGGNAADGGPGSRSSEGNASERSPSSLPPPTVANVAEGYLSVQGGLRLYHCEFVPERRGSQQAGAVVAIMHGYGEHCRRYDELASYLVHKGHAVCLLDARGHGRSQGQRGHVSDYDEYVEDFLVFIERVRAQHRGRPLYVLGHSNGALIALRAILRGLSGVQGLVLTGPLLELSAQRKAVPDALARLLSRVLPWLPRPNGIRAEQLTHDPALVAAHRQDRWVHGFATPRWYWSMTLAAREVRAAAPRLDLPLLIVQGELDSFVAPAAVADFYARAGSTDKQLIVRAGELHEVLNETGRVELFKLIAAWLKRPRPGQL